MGGMTGLLLLLWVGVTVSTAVNLQKRIIGGHDCLKTERLYHVKLIGNNGTHENLCGGSLISKWWILTAAHCLFGRMTAYLRVDPTGQNLQMIQITDPPRIFFDNQQRQHDIMLLKLPRVTFIKPVERPDCTNLPEIGSQVQMAGYAATTAGPNGERQQGRSRILQCVNINLVDCQGLRNTLQTLQDDYHYQHWLCYQTPRVDTCSGDSGGGVVYNNMIYGVHVFTSDDTHACVEPAAFMDICNQEYNKWINDTIA